VKEYLARNKKALTFALPKKTNKKLGVENRGGEEPKGEAKRSLKVGKQ